MNRMFVVFCERRQKKKLIMVKSIFTEESLSTLRLHFSNSASSSRELAAMLPGAELWTYMYE